MKKNILSLTTLFIFLSISSFSQTIDYASHQNRFMDKMQDGVAIIYASKQKDELNNDFYYLTGSFDLSGIIVLNPKNNPSVMYFSDNENKKFKQQYALNQFRRMLSRQLFQNDLWVSFSNLNKIKNLSYAYATKKSLINTDPLFYELRELKDDDELALITKAVNITAASYNKVFQWMKIGMTENQIIDKFKQHQLDLGAESTSFIQAGSGVNGTQIHANPTDKIIEKGDLVVFDVGAWHQKYTSDISRTVPASGKFTKHQKVIYELVLNAQKAGIAEMVQGAIMGNVQKVVEDVLIDGLYELGLITDKQSKWQRQLYLVHGYYHYIGLDIHDYYSFMAMEKNTKAYEAGMIMTMEPGLYFPPTLLDKKPRRAANLTDEEFNTFVSKTRKNFDKYVNMGVRIEDDVLITKDGNKVLSNSVPKEIKEIEKLMNRN